MDIIWGKNLINYCYQENQYGSFGVVGYPDSNYISDIDDQKSITVYRFSFGKTITH